MKCIATVRNLLLALAAITLVHSAPASAGTVELPIVQGHIQTGGAFSYYRDRQNLNQPDSDWVLNVAPMAEFFLMDRISIGAAAGLSWVKSNNQTTFTHTVSPAITWYFLDLNPMEVYVHQAANFGWGSDVSHPTSWTTALGVSMFFSKNVAFAPQVEWHYGNQMKGFWDVAGAFQIFF